MNVKYIKIFFKSLSIYVVVMFLFAGFDYKWWCRTFYTLSEINGEKEILARETKAVDSDFSDAKRVRCGEE